MAEIRRHLFFSEAIPASDHVHLVLYEGGGAGLRVCGPDRCSDTVVEIRREDVAAVLEGLSPADITPAMLADIEASLGRSLSPRSPSARTGERA